MQLLPRLPVRSAYGLLHARKRRQSGSDRRGPLRIECRTGNDQLVVAEDASTRDVEAAKERVLRVIVAMRLRVVERGPLVGEGDGAVRLCAERDRPRAERRRRACSRLIAANESR